MGLRKRPVQMTATTFNRNVSNKLNLNAPVHAFRHVVMSWDGWRPGMDVSVKHLKQEQLPDYVFPEGMYVSYILYINNNMPCRHECQCQAFQAGPLPDCVSPEGMYVS